MNKALGLEIGRDKQICSHYLAKPSWVQFGVLKTGDLLPVSDAMRN